MCFTVLHPMDSLERMYSPSIAMHPGKCVCIHASVPQCSYHCGQYFSRENHRLVPLWAKLSRENHRFAPLWAILLQRESHIRSIVGNASLERITDSCDCHDCGQYFSRENHRLVLLWAMLAQENHRFVPLWATILPRESQTCIGGITSLEKITDSYHCGQCFPRCGQCFSRENHRFVPLWAMLPQRGLRLVSLWTMLLQRV